MDNQWWREQYPNAKERRAAKARYRRQADNAANRLLDHMEDGGTIDTLPDSAGVQAWDEGK